MSASSFLLTASLSDDQIPAIVRQCAISVRQSALADGHGDEQAACNQLSLLRLRLNPATCHVHVQLPHRLFGSWLNAQLPAWQQHLERAVRKVCGQEWTVVWGADAPPVPGRTGVPPFQSNGPVEAADPEHADTQTDTQPDTPFPERIAETGAEPNMPYGAAYTLDTYLVNAKNQFPMNVLREAITGNPAYTLLVLYGLAGTGKTHLTRAVGNALSLRAANGILFCGSADDLAMIAAAGSLHDAYRRLSAFHAIIIDDVDRLPVLPRLGDVLPMVIDHCRDQGKLFVCTTRQHPSAWGALPHLVGSRLDQALIMSLHEADMDIRLRYAQMHSQRLRLHLSRTQLLTLARQCASLRRLIGVLQRLAALRDLIGHDISAQDMERALSHTADTGVMTPQLIIRVTAVRCGVRPEDILGASRRPKTVRARQVALYLCRELLGSSYPALGRIFGDRDHSTIIHAVKKIEILRDNDKDTHNLVTELSLTCRQTAK